MVTNSRAYNRLILAISPARVKIAAYLTDFEHEGGVMPYIV